MLSRIAACSVQRAQQSALSSSLHVSLCMPRVTAQGFSVTSKLVPLPFSCPHGIFLSLLGCGILTWVQPAFRAQRAESQASPRTSDRSDLFVSQNSSRTGESKGTFTDGDQLQVQRSTRAERRRVRWNDHGWRWRQHQEERTYFLGTCSQDSRRSARDHPGNPRHYLKKRGRGLATGSTKYCLVAGISALSHGAQPQPLQPSTKDGTAVCSDCRRCCASCAQRARRRRGTEATTRAGVGPSSSSGSLRRAQPCWAPAESTARPAAVTAFYRENAALKSAKKLLTTQKKYEKVAKDEGEGQGRCRSSSQPDQQRQEERRGKPPGASGSSGSCKTCDGCSVPVSGRLG